MLTGTGTINAGAVSTNPSYQLRIQSGGTVDPGTTSGPGILTTSDIIFEHTNSNFDIQLDGTTAGTGYDQLKVNGTVTLNGNLNVDLLTSFASVNDTFTIIDNDETDPIVGTFNGLPESGLVEYGGNIWSISYVGGTDNNDVVLTTTSTNQFPTGDAQTVTTDEDTSVNIALSGE